MDSSENGRTQLTPSHTGCENEIAGADNGEEEHSSRKRRSSSKHISHDYEGERESSRSRDREGDKGRDKDRDRERDRDREKDRDRRHRDRTERRRTRDRDDYTNLLDLFLYWQYFAWSYSCYVSSGNDSAGISCIFNHFLLFDVLRQLGMQGEFMFVDFLRLQMNSQWLRISIMLCRQLVETLPVQEMLSLMFI